MVHHKLISEQGSSTNGSTHQAASSSNTSGIKQTINTSEGQQPSLPPLVLSDIESEGGRSGSIISQSLVSQSHNNQQPLITEAENNGNTHLPSETVINTNHLV